MLTPMVHIRSVSRSALLALTLLSACAASGPTASVSASGPRKSPPGNAAPGAFGAYLAGRFAANETDLDVAADNFLHALAADPGNEELQQQAFLATLMAGRPDAVRLARGLKDNQAAQLLLADQDVKAGNWDNAELRFRALPKQGLTQVLQPVLLAWAQQGAGHTDAALATLRPYMEGQRFRGVYTLHAALIADLANRPADAAKLYRLAEAEAGGTNLRLAQILASWQTRQGHPADAQRTLAALAEQGDELSIALPTLGQGLNTRPVPRAADGIAEAYLALAAALRQQDASDFSLILLRLALDLRPDYTAARLLIADVMDSGKHPAAALKVLSAVPPSDPLAPVIRLRRAALTEREGNTDDAMKQLEQLARDEPTRPEPLAMLGDLMRTKQRFPEAVSAYDRAIARIGTPATKDWPLFYDRGIAEERAHQWGKAEADLQRALQLSPDQPYVLNYLAYSWTEQGHNLTQARRMIDRAVEQRPNDGSIVDSLGWVQLRQGDSAGAIKSLERAVELEPEDATINGHLGDAYSAAGRKLEAQFQWRRALTLNPEPDDAAKLEAKLHEGAQAGNGPTTADRRVQ